MLKPDRQTILDFIMALPVRKIPSVGGMTETTLKEIGIITGQDLYEKAHEVMIAYNKYPKMYEFLLRRALGLSSNTHDYEEKKGVSISETFTYPLKTKEQFRFMISKLSKELSERMKTDDLAGLVVFLQLKLTNFNEYGKQMKQLKHVYQHEQIRDICYKILDSLWPCEPVRLICIAVNQCKKQKEIKLEKSLNEFQCFKKVSKDQMLEDQEKQMARIKDQIIEGKNHGKVESQTEEEKKQFKKEQRTLIQMFTRQSEKFNTKEIENQNNTETKIEGQQESTINKKRNLNPIIKGISTKDGVKRRGVPQSQKVSTKRDAEQAALMVFFKKEK